MTTKLSLFILYGWIIVFLLILLSACSFSSGPTGTPTPDLPVKEIVQRSSQAMLKAETLHFSIKLSGRLAYIDRPPTTALKSVVGDLLRPDSLRAIVKVSTLGLVSEVGLISIGKTSYVTNPINQRWQILPPEWGWYFDPRAPFDEHRGIPAVIPHVPFRKLGMVEIDGQPYYHVEGMAQGKQITGWTAGLIVEGEVPVTMWIDPQTFLIRRVELVETATDPERPTTWVIEFTDYGQELEVEAPPVE
ncbi:LppX_LprAFG lipoprotein [Anaerolineales bacterium HSG24]|nr:LppX_LprAFG lipoprotein [Anaerolineales bacterium HSG24]